MTKIENLIRPHLKCLSAYSSARDEFSGKAKIFLDANENALGSALYPKLNRYPDPYQLDLKKAIGKLKHIPPEQIFLGNGSDEPIDLLIRLFCEPKQDKIVLCPPTYGMYQVSASINNVDVLDIPLNESFHLETEKILEQADPECKLLFLCSPNNPTGNLLRPEAIELLLSKFGGIVVIDEAYIDFAKAPSWTKRLSEFPNLVVLQTFSKAWGLAGLRLGMAFASEEIIGWLNKIKSPYNLSSLTQKAALKALNNETLINQQAHKILAMREDLKEKLLSLPFVETVYHSHANFLLIKTKHADSVYQSLLQKEIVVRNRSQIKQCEGGLRITVGTESENAQLIKALQSFNPENHTS